MRRLIPARLVLLPAIIFLVLAALAGAPPRQATALGPDDFTVKAFEADYYLDRDAAKTSTLRVVEKIVAAFPDYDQNHGILRSIPKTYQDHSVSLEVESVTSPNGPWRYTTSTENDNLVLKIGDPDRYVHGEQTFVITYRMRNVISFLDSHQELYWDINGDEWRQPFTSVAARLHVPAAIAGSLQDRLACFAGPRGGTGTGGCQIVRGEGEGDSALITATTEDLAQRETLTIVTAFNQDTFAPGPEIARDKFIKLALVTLMILAVIVPPLAAFIVMYQRWRQYGKDPAGKGVLIPQYQPHQELNALESDYLLNEKLRTTAPSALLIELAIDKYVTIYEVKKGKLLKSTDYELELIKHPSDLKHDELLVLQMFFGTDLVVGDKVKLSDLKNKRASELQKLNEYLGRSLHEKGYFSSDPNKARSRYVLRGVLLLAVGFVLLLTGILTTLGIGLMLGGGIVIIFSSIMPARSVAGVAIREHLLGMKEYMQLAEADRIKFLQSPRGAEKIRQHADLASVDPRDKIKLFESLLPFAMLFGIEKDWAKQFEDIYQNPPDWYRGPVGSFNSVHLASSLGSFSESNSATFTSPSSSGSSGFGGGGSSGGGGGGGGGGGW